MRWKGLPRIVMGAVVVGGLCFMAVSYKAYDYVQHDPSFCTSCHTMDDAHELWATSEHSKVTCHACHTPDLASNLHQLWVYMTDPPDKPRHHAEVPNDVCYSCHRVEGDGRERQPSRANVLKQAGHIEHVVKQKIQCVRCHSTSLHSFNPPDDLCVSCHKHQSLLSSGMDQHCTFCHDYRATGRESLQPTRDDCLSCHDVMQVNGEIFPAYDAVDSEDLPMNWDCGDCHKPHSQPNSSTEDCADCHEVELDLFEIHANEFHEDCIDCHRPHLWGVDDAKVCLECHEDATEHAEGEFCVDCH